MRVGLAAGRQRNFPRDPIPQSTLPFPNSCSGCIHRSISFGLRSLALPTCFGQRQERIYLLWLSSGSRSVQDDEDQTLKLVLASASRC